MPGRPPNQSTLLVVANACSLAQHEIVITNIKETVLENYWELELRIQTRHSGRHTHGTLQLIF